MWLICLDGSPGIQGNTDRTFYKEHEMNIFFLASTEKLPSSAEMIPSNVLQRANIWNSRPALHLGFEPFILRAVSPKKTWNYIELLWNVIQDRDHGPHLEAIHHGDKEGDHQDVVKVGDLEEATGWGLLHSAVGQVEIHEEIQNWSAKILLIQYGPIFNPLDKVL